MKNKLFVLLSMLLLLFTLGANNPDEKGGAQDVVRELSDFQNALLNWMKGFDSIKNQFSAFQKEVEQSLAPLKEFDKTIKGTEEKMNTVLAKIDIVEKSSSVAEIKQLIEAFGKTFEVFKKNMSDLTKRIEDQEIKNAVLEKRVMETQKPIEPVKKALEELSKVVMEKLSDQEKRIVAAEDVMKTRVASLDAATKNFDGQIKALADLETRTKKLEKGGFTVAATATPAPTPAPQTSAGTETAAAVAATTTGTETVEVVKEQRVVTPEEEGFKDIGDGFYLRNANVSQFGSSSQIKGEIKNAAEKDRSIATFVIRVFNAADVVLFSQDFSIKTFKSGEVRNFSEIISGYTPLDIAKYEVITKRRY
ncbi:MAG: hypothetical protein HZB37_10305 [Planctomycetes bacterium]|nr:hypothetical protein [Planctomycetota bacterium]